MLQFQRIYILGVRAYIERYMGACMKTVTVSGGLSLIQVVTQADPDLVALHCQEIGGKDFDASDIKPKASRFIALVQCVHTKNL